ncbi:hypothetical protein [Helicobacter sp.]|nr:hypothetical protein [Helicobacter sp.]
MNKIQNLLHLAQEAEKRLLSGTSLITLEDLAKKAKLNASERG